MTLFGGVKILVRVLMTTCLILTWFAIVHAGNAATATTDTVSSKDIIMILFGLLQTVFMAIGVWMISNDKELFTRMGAAETKIATRDAICERISKDGDHHHQRASDNDSEVALKESVDMLRRALHEASKKKLEVGE